MWVKKDVRLARGIDKLTALQVKKTTAPGYYGDGGGLWLQVGASGTKSWIFRFKSPVLAKSREMGLGSLDTYTLAEARVRAKEARQVVDRGQDPIEQRKAQRRQSLLSASLLMTFAQCAEAYIEAHQAGWKNHKHAGQWRSTLSTYAFPVIGKLPVSSIDTPLVLRILEPIWTAKNETATRLRGRIELVLDWSTVRGYRTGNNPARWKGHLDKLLAPPSKVQKVNHHPALAYPEISEFMKSLAQREGMASLALQFVILTAARSGEVRGARWDEIDRINRTWTIPASRMKAGKEHQIPLSDAAISVLNKVPVMIDNPLVFPAPRGGLLSDMTMAAVLKRMEWNDLTVHGFRSTFRDWAGETTGFPREVIEHALAHQLKDKAEAAYARGTLFAKRRLLMDEWANYCKNTTA